ncbi:unnamed protein product [Ilex paraguariensis]|uniref:18S rRNA (guanine(1575)-N(7))-methyltransferase Bud23 C-terminal domain-containing protein n=1 Tax=Ilex paraguariensis TaxID=185542 RepID=A0ABC8T5G9_9AQUA
MSSRPELQSQPEIFYNDEEARKYTSSSCIIESQAQQSERDMELLALPDDGVPRLLIDIGIALEREVEGDLMLADMGQDEGFRPGVIDGAINISAVQWLCNADKTSHDPRLRLKAFFGSLYRCLTRGARAVLQVYPEKLAQRELILGFAMRSGFAGGVFVHNPHSTKKRKEYLVLNCGPPSLSAATPQGKREQEESCSDDEGSGDKENQTVYSSVCISGRQRPRKKQKITKKGNGREWVMKKKEQMRRREMSCLQIQNTKLKRKARF